MKPTTAEQLLHQVVDGIMERYNGCLPEHLVGPYIGNCLAVVESAEIGPDLVDVLAHRGTKKPVAIITGRLIQAALKRPVNVMTDIEG